MRLSLSLAFEATTALLTAYLFFSLTGTAGRKSFHPALRTDSALTTFQIPIQTDTLAERERPPGVAQRPFTPVEAIVVEHGSRGARTIALTFDACSTRDPSNYDERITSILIQTGTPATLFLGGKWMLEEPEQTKQLAANPLFELGNHTFLHPHLREVSDKRIREELVSTQNIMDSLTGRRAILFRPPYGEYDDRVVRIAASLGLKTVQFDLASGDPDPAIAKERLVEYVSSMARSGSIVVMHINRRGWHTAEALPEIISRLRQRGFMFKTVSGMLLQNADSGQGKNK